MQGEWAGRFGQNRMLVMSVEMLTRTWVSCWFVGNKWQGSGLSGQFWINSHTHVSSCLKYVPQASFALYVLWDRVLSGHHAQFLKILVGAVTKHFTLCSVASFPSDWRSQSPWAATWYWNSKWWRPHKDSSGDNKKLLPWVLMFCYKTIPLEIYGKYVW